MSLLTLTKYAYDVILTKTMHGPVRSCSYAYGELMMSMMIVLLRIATLCLPSPQTQRSQLLSG